MNELTIVKALKSLGFSEGWAVTENQILVWENEAPQPTEAELIAAGWEKPDEAPTADA